MSDYHDPMSSSPERPPLTVIPVMQQQQPPRPRTSTLGVLFRSFFVMAFLGCIAVIIFLVVILFLGFRLPEDGGSSGLYERYHSGDRKSLNKIAVVKMEGVIMEGMIGFCQKQIEEAVRDDRVKAVVLRINSPGGSITASDDLHRRLKQLRDGTTPGHVALGKPIVVSMGALTASGGYYISMPAEHLVAEPTTITGSIGVYASFPNISGLADKYGFGMNTIKAGEVKDSGSMFKEMTPQEKQLWQDMVDHAFDQFLDIVAAGRPKLSKEKLRENIPDETRELTVKEKDGKEKKVQYTRKRADGGIYTADKALKYGLIDQVGYLEDAVTDAATRAGLGSDYRAVSYEHPPSLMDIFMKSQAPAASTVDAAGLSRALTPRMWYLAPQSELAGLLSVLGRE